MRRLILVVLLLGACGAAAAPAADAAKPVVVFFRPQSCARCDQFEHVTVPHPAVQRRLAAVSFSVRQGESAYVAYFDSAGALRVRWPVIPDATNFGIILDSVLAVAPHFERAVELTGKGDPYAGDVAAAVGFARIGRTSDATAALARAKEHGRAEVRKAALEVEATLEPPEKPRRLPVGSIQILPLARQVVSGREVVKTRVANAAVAQVVFTLDGRNVARAERPPFAAALDFGKVPERHVVRVVAFDHEGEELGSDERVVNEAGEVFSLSITSPRESAVSGSVRVSMNVRAPAGRKVRRVTLSWNDAQRAVLTSPPWSSTVPVAEGEVGVLRAVAELDDGRATEDAVLLNAGKVEEVDVQLIGLPLTVVSRGGAAPELTPERISVWEQVSSRASARDPLPAGDSVTSSRPGMTQVPVQSIATAAETPLTIGLLIDISGSMHKPLADVQEAAIRFLQSALGPKDRAFFVAFDEQARLLQPATSDLSRLTRRIMGVRPEGRTALHDALVLGLLQFEGTGGRRAIVLFSDGLDMTSQYGANDVAELARRVNVPIHVITADPEDRSLERVALATGGTFQRLTDLNALPAIYARIEAALRAQVLAFVCTESGKKPNEWRNIEVKIEGEGLDVYAPAGYYVP